MTPRPLASVVIPAHNEEAVIGRLLRGIAEDSQPGEFEIIVAANGCTDRTVQHAKDAANGITVVNVAEPSKIAGLNAGDAAATVFPRIYLDADVMVSASTLRELANVLSDGDGPEARQEPAPLAAAPALRTDLSGASWFVRSHYRIWELTDYRTKAHIGSGIYALSRQGRARFSRFPDVIADDRFVQQLFTDSERLTLSHHCFTVHSPKTLRALLRRATRAAAGNLQLKTGGYCGDRAGDTASGTQRRLLAKVLRRPALWPSLAVYCIAYIIPRLLAVHKIQRGRLHIWERDETSRQWC